MAPNLKVSLVVPVYNEEKRVENGLSKIFEFLGKQKYSWEVIVVDDGSQDFTVSLAEKKLKRQKNAKLVKSQHLGKGGAIKQGVLKSEGNWVLFLDIDLATPVEELNRFLKFCDENDIIIGSRKMRGSKIEVHQPAFREFAGKIFTQLTNLLLTGNISDITCGFKLFRSEVAKELFAKSQLNDWSFDAEILFMAKKHRFKIKEVPVRWKNDPHTKVDMFRDTGMAFLGLLKIRFFDLIGKYD